MERRGGGLSLIQELVRTGQYDWSNHVDAQIEASRFEEADLEACILSGAVSKTERDRLLDSVGRKI